MTEPSKDALDPQLRDLPEVLYGDGVRRFADRAVRLSERLPGGG